MNKTSGSIRFIFFIICSILIYVGSTVYASEGLVLKIESVKDEYVVREPVKFIVTFYNRSDEDVGIMPCWDLTDNMKYMLLKIRTPGGEEFLARNYYWIDHGLQPGKSYYEGVPLNPGDSLETFLYPNITLYHNPETMRPVPQSRAGITFREVGEYEVRIVYVVPAYLVNLWREGGVLSEPITIRFREPTPEEDEILDAYCWGEIAMGDHSTSNSYNRKLLKRVIAKYPDHPMIKYAYFGLAIDLIYEESREAINILEMLRNKYPTFRFEEVMTQLARAYKDVGEREKALGIMKEALEKRPALKDHSFFMEELITISTGTASGFLPKWKRAIREGKEIYIDNKGELKIIEE
jgi:tetratricopeptide (TPR) repeat protein